MNTLPSEIQGQILKFVPPNELRKSNTVCKQWDSLCKNIFQQDPYFSEYKTDICSKLKHVLAPLKSDLFTKKCVTGVTVVFATGFVSLFLRSVNAVADPIGTALAFGIPAALGYLSLNDANQLQDQITQSRRTIFDNAQDLEKS